eukprot:5311043-Pyramimonas_sp.AAC.1
MATASDKHGAHNWVAYCRAHEVSGAGILPTTAPQNSTSTPSLERISPPLLSTAPQASGRPRRLREGGHADQYPYM